MALPKGLIASKIAAVIDAATAGIAANVASIGSHTTAISALQAKFTTAPASAGATGVAGQIANDTGFIYVCTATNTWKRVAIATW